MPFWRQSSPSSRAATGEQVDADASRPGRRYDRVTDRVARPCVSGGVVSQSSGCRPESCFRWGGSSWNRVFRDDSCRHHRGRGRRECRPGRGRSGGGEERARIERGLEELNGRLARLRAAEGTGPERLADAEVFAKGIAWALSYETTLDAGRPGPAGQSAGTMPEPSRGRSRAARQPWADEEGPGRPRLRLRGGRLGAALRPDRSGEVRPASPCGSTSCCTAAAGRWG